jgi:hypothetical protein
MWKTMLAVLVFPAAGCAWGTEGHSLVARIAEAQPSAAVRARVAENLGPGRTLSSIASWAGEVRRSRPGTAPWHYLNIPIGEPHLDMMRDCPANNCVLAQERQPARNVARPCNSLGSTDRDADVSGSFCRRHAAAPALRDNHDKGGNEVLVTLAGQATNLHSAWDTV